MKLYRQYERESEPGNQLLDVIVNTFVLETWNGRARTWS